MNKNQLSTLLLSAIPSLAFAQTRPNIIYIMCDDLGYGDLHCYGQQHIDTPHLDQMAAQGMMFTQAYAGSPVSAPSRACFMTGIHSGHNHVRGNREYWQGKTRENMFGQNPDYYIIGQEPYRMDQRIIPEIFKAEGYATGMFGKWAAGYLNLDHPDDYAADADGNTDTREAASTSSLSLPHRRGVDVYYGPICQFQAHAYFPNFLNRYDPERFGDTHMVVDTLKENILHKDVTSADRDYERRTQYSAELVHRYALDWLERRAADESGRPFLGIFTYTLPHAELWQPQDELVEKYDKRYAEQYPGQEKAFRGEFGSWYYRNGNSHAQFAAMVERLDRQVGEVLDKVRELGLEKNTIVIFTSDNGPHEEGGADPEWFGRENAYAHLEGIKRSCHEGGIRVPFIAWGGGVKAGTVSHLPFAFYDLLPTFCQLAGIDAKKHKSGPNDRLDGISIAPTLTGKGRQKHHHHLYWEFHNGQQFAVRQGKWKLYVAKTNTTNPQISLYNLDQDPSETRDLAARHPKRVSQMLSIIRQEHHDNPLFPIALP